MFLFIYRAKRLKQFLKIRTSTLLIVSLNYLLNRCSGENYNNLLTWERGRGILRRVNKNRFWSSWFVSFGLVMFFLVLIKTNIEIGYTRQFWIRPKWYWFWLIQRFRCPKTKGKWSFYVVFLKCFSQESTVFTNQSWNRAVSLKVKQNTGNC